MYTHDKFGSFLLFVLFVLYLSTTFAAPSTRIPTLTIRQDSNLTVSGDGSCGGSSGQTCEGSTFGDCCSSKGFCGKNESYCTTGCQGDFGQCPTSDTSSDGSCGGPTSITCVGSEFGNCCSARGYCGSGSSYCGSGCQSDFGSCGVGNIMSISSDGTCGGPDKISCQGSDYGNCCSQRGYCGANVSYCSSGCQSEFGTCFPSASHSSSVDLSSSTAIITDTATNSEAMSDGGISGGVIAGAVVGAVGGVCLAGLGMFFVWRMRKARSSERLTSGAHTRDPSLHGDQKPVPELQVNEAVSPHQEALVSSTPYYEMPIGKRHENFVKRPAELDTSQAFEMPAEDHCLRK